MGRIRSDATQAAHGDRRFITALARGLSVLQCFKPHERWLPHQEIVRRTGLPSATVSRLAFTLVSLGYLKHRSSAGEYALSAAVLALGFSMLTGCDLGRVAQPFMQTLADVSRAAVSLGVRHELSMVYIANCSGTDRLTLGLDVGARIPIAVTAMGRAVLCAAAEPERERLHGMLEAADPAAWPKFRAGLTRAMEMFTERGFVTSESEWEADISSIGAVIDIGGGCGPFGLTIGGPSSYLKGRFLYDELGPKLVQVARDITAAVHAGRWRD